MPRAWPVVCWLRPREKHLVLLPGVPREFRDILDKQVLPPIAPLLGSARNEGARAVVAGLPRWRPRETLRPWYGKPGIDVSILPALGVLRIGFTFTGPPLEDLEEAESQVRRALSEGLRATS